MLHHANRHILHIIMIVEVMGNVILIRKLKVFRKEELIRKVIRRVKFIKKMKVMKKVKAKRLKEIFLNTLW